MTDVTSNIVQVITIGSSGFMGLAAVLIVIMLLRNRTPPTRALGTAVIVIVLAAAMQLSTKLIDAFVVGKGRISVSLEPNPRLFGAGFGLQGPLPAPRLWIENGNRKCNPNAVAEFDAESKECLIFAQKFNLNGPDETIHVSVEQAFSALQEKLMRIQAAQGVTVGNLIGGTGAARAPSPIGEDIPSNE